MMVFPTGEKFSGSMETSGKNMFMALWLLGCQGGTNQPVDDVDTVETADSTDTVETDDSTETVDTTDDTVETVDTTPPAPDCILGSTPPELQTGTHVFTPLVDGQGVESTRGPQGGQHIWGSVTCTGINPGTSSSPLDPSTPRVDFWIEQDGISIGGYHDLPRPMLREWGTGLIGDQLVLWINEYWETVDLEVTLHFHVRDVDGVEVDRSVRLHTVADPSMVPPADTDIPVP